MAKINCWEYWGCGRQAGGPKADELGICPASTAKGADGVHGGVNGGRACWGVVGTMCDGRVQNDLLAKLQSCVGCEFHARVDREEPSLTWARDITAMTK